MASVRAGAWLLASWALAWVAAVILTVVVIRTGASQAALALIWDGTGLLVLSLAARPALSWLGRRHRAAARHGRSR